MKLMHRKPNRLFPQPNPRCAYIGGPAKVIKALQRTRRIRFAASAEAAAPAPNASTRYNCVGSIMKRNPMAMKNVPMMGTIQCVRSALLQPYQKKPMAGKGEQMIFGIRCLSGVHPPLAFQRFLCQLLTAVNAAKPTRKPIPSPR